MKNYKTFFENTILSNIDFTGYEVNPENDFDKIKEVYKTFKSEFLHENNKHQNKVFLFSEWLRGLPSVLTVPFYNYEILENAKNEGFFTTVRISSENGQRNEPSKGKILENQENRFLDNYWLNLSNAFFTLKNNL
jgi:hypothetical protein